MKPNRNSFLRNAHHNLAAILVLGSCAQAAEYVWDADNATDLAQDGSDIVGEIWGVPGQQGNWFVTPNNNQNWADSHTATFGASAGGTYSVTVGGTINTGNGTSAVGSLNFKQSGYTLSGVSSVSPQIINIGVGTANVTLAAGVTATIGNHLSVIKNNTSNTSLFLFGSSNASNVGTLQIGTGTPGGGSVLESKSNNNVNLSRGITVDVRTGGAFTSASSIVVGATGTNESGYTNSLKVSGGTVNVNGNFLILGNSYNVNATSSAAEVTIGSGEIKLNATGGGLRFGSSNANITTNGTVNLNGGTLTAAQVLKAGPNGTHTATFNFNGGELKVLAGSVNANSFMIGLNTVQIRDGGAKINTNGVNTTIGHALVHSVIAGDLATDGGLEKLGAGTLKLTNSNTYTGNTTVSSGTLELGNGTTNSSLNDSAGVVIGADPSAVLHLNFPSASASSDTVKTLIIDGVQKAAGVWGSSDSGADNTDPHFAGTGTLTVTDGPSTSAYDTWATTSHGLSGANAAFDFDYDNDGIKNGLEWILGGNPTTSSSGILPAATRNISGDLVLTFTRLEASISESTLVVEIGTDLATWSKQVTIGATGSGPDVDGVTVDIDTVATPDAVTVTIPSSQAAGGKLFTRLKATRP